MLAFLRSLNTLIPSEGILNRGVWHLPWHCPILSKEPLLQPSPGAAKANQRLALGQFPPLPGTHPRDICILRDTRRLRNHGARAGMGNHPSQSQQSPREHSTIAEGTLDARHNTLATGLGICWDNGRLAAPTQGQEDE